MTGTELQEALDNWQLPEDGPLLNRIERMIEPALMGRLFASSPTAILCGLQYHLGGERDTRELAELASITANDSVLDVCCYLGGPAIQLAQTYGCRVTGVDITERFVTAATRIAELSGLSHLLDFRVGDAASLPFRDARFTVVWNQCSLNHDETWLREYDRVLTAGGRLALTFDIRQDNPDKNTPKWRLPDLVGLLQDLGYSVGHAEDITERDIRIGWQALDDKLSAREPEFEAVFGRDWVQNTRQEFAGEIRRMREGRWGNGRIVATKRRT